MQKNKGAKQLIELVLFVLLVIGIWVASYFLFRNITPYEFQKFVLSLGIFAPLVFLIFQIIEIFILPIPAAFLTSGAGAAFGFYKGVLLVALGTMLSHSFVFFLTRRFGKPFIRKVLSRKTIRKYENSNETKSTYLLFISRLIFFIPSNIISMFAGLTNMEYKHFFAATFFGLLPYIIFWPYIGSGAAQGSLNIISLIVVAIILFVLSAALTSIFRNRLRRKKPNKLRNK
ncbi:MAG: TVP38/TMEM64 family protein [Nanoarchaeota archaeon]|nr:TVP38/TMEM64 family protein [Nanoarchaeota archaeon]